jgi:SAM-dependent methyltransferase
MDEREFDRYAEEYSSLLAASIGASGEAPDFFAEYKIADIARAAGPLAARAAAENPPRPLAICDFGAGIGESVPWVRRYLPRAQLTCVDVSRRSLELAERRFPGAARFVVLAGEELPLASGEFDIVYAACVFHHIPAADHLRLLGELRRLLRPGGLLFVFEHNPWNPLTVRVVRSCPFDENAVLMSAPTLKRRLVAAGFPPPATRYRIFFPHALRALRPLEPWLAWLPLGGQYCLIARR